MSDERPKPQPPKEPLAVHPIGLSLESTWRPLQTALEKYWGRRAYVQGGIKPPAYVRVMAYERIWIRHDIGDTTTTSIWIDGELMPITIPDTTDVAELLDAHTALDATFRSLLAPAFLDALESAPADQPDVGHDPGGSNEFARSGDAILAAARSIWADRITVVRSGGDFAQFVVDGTFTVTSIFYNPRELITQVGAEGFETRTLLGRRLNIGLSEAALLGNYHAIERWIQLQR